MGGLSVAGAFAGGLGLFLLGLWLATEGVKLAGGSVLKANLRTWACNRWRSFETGFAIALLVPSSGASTRAAIGFVNSGLVKPANALPLVVGCSFGSVVTAWLVVALGLSPNAFVFALALVGAGVLTRASGHHARYGAWGQALAGLGVLFLGVSVLAGAFESLGTARLDAVGHGFAARVGLFFALGALLSAGLRSSSAVVAAVLAAASTGAIGLSSGMALIAGANLGATAPAGLVLLRSGTPAAKRVALGHVSFHVLASSVALLLLAVGGSLLVQLPGGAPFALATYHLLFKVIGALVFWPLMPSVVKWVAGRFRAEELDAGRPRKVDANLLAVPDLALEGLIEEAHEVMRLARGMAHPVLKGGVLSEFRLRQDVADAQRLAAAVDESFAELAQGGVPAELGDVLVQVPRANARALELCEAVARFRARATPGADACLGPRLRTRLRQLQLAVLHLIDDADPFAKDFSLVRCRAELQAIEGHLTGVRLRMHEACAMGELLPTDVDQLCGRVDELGRVAEIAVQLAASLAYAREPWFSEDEASVANIASPPPLRAVA